MAVKNFIFRKNWVGSKVASIKIVFAAIFGPISTHVLAPANKPKYGIP